MARSWAFRNPKPKFLLKKQFEATNSKKIIRNYPKRFWELVNVSKNRGPTKDRVLSRKDVLRTRKNRVLSWRDRVLSYPKIRQNPLVMLSWCFCYFELLSASVQFDGISWPRHLIYLLGYLCGHTMAQVTIWHVAFGHALWWLVFIKRRSSPWTCSPSDL